MRSVEKILIKSARVYDPSQEWKGEIRDLYLAGDRVSEPFPDPGLTIEAEGRPLLAGGIDPCCQLAIPGQFHLRMSGVLPSLEEIGRNYANMGYVHVHQPVMTLLSSGFVHHWLARIPYVDKSCGVAMDLRDMGHLVRANNAPEFCRMARALMEASGAMGLFLPFPFLRHRQRHYMQKNLSAKRVFSFFSQLEDPEIFPISLWGMPGLLENEIPRPERFHIANLAMALDSRESLEKARGFLEGGGSADLGVSTGREQLLVVSPDGSGSAPLSIDLGLQSPVAFLVARKSLDEEPVKAGWSLLSGGQSPWRLSLSASGPSGGQFGGMPEIVTWLLNPASRPAEIEGSLDGKMIGLYDLARLTRLAPARFLGLADLGHLNPGARASAVIYDLRPGMEAREAACALADCWCLVKDGVVVREEGRFSGFVAPARIRGRHVAEDGSEFSQTDLFQNATLRFEHLGVLDRRK